MNNDKIGSIAVKTEGRPRSRFNLSHDVNTTADFGSIQPLMVRELVPNSKSSVSLESLIRMSPLLSPTFGRIKFKQYHKFVGMSDLTKNFTAFMTQEDVYRANGNFTPQYLPSIELRLLSALCLIGAKCTIWYSHGGASDDDSTPSMNFATSHVTDINNLPPIASSLVSGSAFTSAFVPYSLPYFDGFNGNSIALSYILGIWGLTIPIPISNPDSASFFDVDPIAVSSRVNDDYNTVTLQGADIIITRSSSSASNKTFSYAFRLSSFGKRIRKALIGSGYQIDFNSSETVSLMPLFALYKAYYDSFGLTLYENWERSNVYKLMHIYDADSVNMYSFNTLFVSGSIDPRMDYWWNFVNDLGNMWYTDSQDFVSAHTVTNAIAPGTGVQLGRVVSVDGAPHIDTSDISNILGSLNAPNGHAYIDAVKHGYLDSEYIKTLYYNTNKSTIAGQRLAELMRLLGLGKYVDEDKSSFIGSDETIVTISDVTSTADSFNPVSGSGMVLGEYAGKGVEYQKSKTFSFENEEFGYYIVLACVVPESGYCQALDRNVTHWKPFDFYRPSYDAMGYEASKKNQVVGQRDWATPSTNIVVDGDLQDTFGFIPQDTHMKVKSNILNGDFSLRSTRAGYLPYTLDKFIAVGERQVLRNQSLDTAEEIGYSVNKLLMPANIPTASPIWRYVGRYKWLSLFDRIFNMAGSHPEQNPESFIFDGIDASFVALTACDYDNMLIHNILNFQYYAPMLPIEKSFETYDEETEKPNASIGKA